MTGFKSKKAAALDKLNDDDDTQVYGDAVDNNPVHEAMLSYWGERCSAYHEECVCCQAWEQYDGKTSAQPAREPDVVMHWNSHTWTTLNPPLKGSGDVNLYYAPQRPWVGLTDDEIDVIYEQHHNQYGECESPNFGYERAIETKLKEHNA